MSNHMTLLNVLKLTVADGIVYFKPKYRIGQKVCFIFGAALPAKFLYTPTRMCVIHDIIYRVADRLITYRVGGPSPYDTSFIYESDIFTRKRDAERECKRRNK